jgi:hypothetical protein
MTASPSAQTLRWLFFVVLSLCNLPLFAGVADAASMPILQANAILDFASDRAHMIQISIVVVAIGCAVMWWYR